MSKIQTYKKEWSDIPEVAIRVKKMLYGYTLNMPCGMSRYGIINVDADKKVKPDIICDMFNPPFKRSLFDSIYCDPPWNQNIFNRYKLARTLRDLIKPNGLIILNASWLLPIMYYRNICIVDVEFIVTSAGGISAISTYTKPNNEIDMKKVCHLE